MTAFDVFGLIAPFYDKVSRFAQLDKLVEIGNFPIKGVVLDLAGGTGRVAGSITGLAGEIVVIDLSMGMLQRAKPKPGIRIVNGSADRIPFASQSIERILLFDAFHHLDNQEAAIREMLRVIEPGGKLIIYEPDIQNPSIKLISILETLTLMHSHFVTIEHIEKMFSIKNHHCQVLKDGNSAWITVSS
jgi:demethylmenaquinone methyltransferase/2-methoxy-6-polyprenyl-1,4-benzoquinol methylase